MEEEVCVWRNGCVAVGKTAKDTMTLRKMQFESVEEGLTSLPVAYPVDGAADAADTDAAAAADAVTEKL